MPASTDSTFLAERLIARLSPQRRANLMGRLQGRAADANLAVYTGTIGDVPRARRVFAMLGRLATLAA